MREVVSQPGVTAELKGGPGNQLFANAVGVSVENRLVCPVYLDSHWFRSTVDSQYAFEQFVHSCINRESTPRRIVTWIPIFDRGPRRA